jgi:hypothetical protein
MSDIVWKSFKVGPTEGDWEPASYNAIFRTFGEAKLDRPTGTLS